jgi:pectin lyase
MAALGLNAIKIGSHKTIRGVGSKGIIRGRGLAMFKVQNIILQNLWITDLNPELVFGGDGIDLRAGVDNIL